MAITLDEDMGEGSGLVDTNRSVSSIRLAVAFCASSTRRTATVPRGGDLRRRTGKAG